MLSQLLLVLVSLGLIEYASVPYLWVALVAIGYCAWRFRRATKTLGKLVWLNVGVAALALGAVELWCWHVAVPVAEPDRLYSAWRGFMAHADYGYAPIAPSRTRVVKRYRGDLVYDVVYTIDERGRRVSPPELPPDARQGCVLFFGCSNTFGEGVQDDETMPWQVGWRTGGRYAVRNFGFQGYGPHHMLAALESGNAERAADCEVTHVVHLALYWHTQRVVGIVAWDRDGPRYVLDDDGRAVRAGHFSDVEIHGPLPRRVFDRLDKSFLYGKYLASHLDPMRRPVGPRDFDLLAAIIHRSRDEVARRFPNASFHVLFSDLGAAPYWVAEFMKRVPRPGLPVHLLSGAIPDYRAPKDPRYVLSVADSHPNPVSYARYADYVITDILHEPPPDPVTAQR